MNRSNMLTVFLDLTCCGAGGLLLVTFFLSPTVSKSKNHEAIMIKCEQITGKDAREIGIRYRRPGSTEWNVVRDDEDSLIYLSSITDDNKGEAFLIIKDTTPGVWEFKGYQVNYPKNKEYSSIQMRLSSIGENKIKNVRGVIKLPAESTSESLKIEVLK